MRATDFEVRNQTTLHLLIVGAAFLTYAFQPDDVVWALVKGHADRTLLERVVFGVGTLEIFSSAALRTWARVRLRYGSTCLYFGRIIFALGVGLLAPASGAAILLAGEGILVLRLLSRERENARATAIPQHSERYHFLQPRKPKSNWPDAFRRESSKWGLAFTMIAFTFTLKDRLAEVLSGVSFLVWFALNLPDYFRSTGSKRNA
jgi:hypothetical protein